jgi:hypothetical protein
MGHACHATDPLFDMIGATSGAGGSGFDVDAYRDHCRAGVHRE